MDSFQDALRRLLNQYSMDSKTGIPDFILTDYLMSHLETLSAMVHRREQWFGRPTQLTNAEALLKK